MKSLEKKSFNVLFTICVFIILASLDNAVIGMFPPLFSLISKDMNFHISALGTVSAMNIFIISASSILWAYMADRGSRKRLIILGTVIWSVSVYLTSLAENYSQLLACQFFLGIGLGCISSVGFSVMTDSVPQKWRGTLMSLWAMSQGFGTIAGSMMASIIAPISSWRRPFEIIALIGSILIILYFFIREPARGGTEPELRKLFQGGKKYDYSIELKQLKELFRKKSNLMLILEGLFIYISNGTLIWLPTLFISKLSVIGFSNDSAMTLSGFLYAISQAGGILSIYLGYVGDKLQKQFCGKRALFAAALLFLSAPLYMLMFRVPFSILPIQAQTGPVSVLSELLKQIFANSNMLVFLLLAISASALNSANYPSWLTLLIDVNLPEHRATIFSIANLVNGSGKALGNLMMGAVLGAVSEYYSQPDNFIISMSIFQMFIIPAAAFYIAAAKSCTKDIKYVRSILISRAENP